MEWKQHHTELNFFGQTFPMNINWQFQIENKKWHCDKCVRRLCQNFQQNLGFL